MTKSPAFQWYPRDILASSRVQMMTLEEEGAYRRLLDYCWLNGSIPADPKRLALLIGKGATVEIAKAVIPMFTTNPAEPGTLIHERLEAERARQEHNRQVRQGAAQSRWKAQETPEVEQCEQEEFDQPQAQAEREQCSENANALPLVCLASSASSAASSSSSASQESAAIAAPPDEAVPRKLSAHPAIQAVRGITHRYPSKDQFEIVILAVGEEPDVGKLKACWQEWRKRDYSPLSLVWATDWYRDGIPTYSKNGRNDGKPPANQQAQSGSDEFQFKASRSV